MPSELTNLRGKLISGRLTDIRPYSPDEDLTNTVPLIEMPTTLGPFGYDSGTQTAIQLTIETVKDYSDVIITTSPNDVVAVGMSITPEIGDYDVLFTGAIELGRQASSVTMDIWFNGSLVPASEVFVSSSGSAVSATSQAHITVTAIGQIVEGRWRAPGGGVMRARTLIVKIR